MNKHKSWIATLAAIAMLVGAGAPAVEAAVKKKLPATMSTAAAKALERQEGSWNPLQGRNYKALPENEAMTGVGCPGDLRACGSVTTGALATGEVDYYHFVANAGDVITVQTFEDADPFMDTVLRLYDDTCSTLLFEDDDNGPALFSKIRWCVEASGTYVVAVSGFQGEAGTYNLSIDCAAGGEPVAGDTCEGAPQLCCGAIYRSGTTDSPCVWNNYSPQVVNCTHHEAKGRDVVYRIDAQAGWTLNLTYTSTADGSIYLVRDCSNIDDTCVAGADQGLVGEPEYLSYTFPFSGTYYLILDSWGLDTAGDWTLTGDLQPVEGNDCAMLVALNDVEQSVGVDELVTIPDAGTGVAGLVGSLGANFIESEAIATHCFPEGERMFVADNDRLVELDPYTGVGTEIGPIGFPDVDGLAFSPQTGHLWGATHFSSEIIKIDVGTGTGTLMASDVLVSHPMADLAFHPNGDLYVLTEDFPQRVYLIDPYTGAKLRRWILNPDVRSMESLLWSPDGSTLYSAADRGFGAKDLVTITLDMTPGSEAGTAAFVSALPSGFPDLEGLAWCFNVESSQALLLGWETTTDVDPGVAPRHGRRLTQNRPNPFNPSTRIAFELPRRERVVLLIHDVAGRLVTTLRQGTLGPGRHEVQWDGRGDSGRPVAAGIYRYTLRGAGWSESRSMVLVK